MGFDSATSSFLALLVNIEKYKLNGKILKKVFNFAVKKNFCLVLSSNPSRNLKSLVGQYWSLNSEKDKTVKDKTFNRTNIIATNSFESN